jgi:Zn finger protein HypA/HybF involved in hydrogenase expression
VPVRQLDPSADTLKPDVDWEGNNAAFTCPKCNQVFVVSAQLHPEGRRCPACQQSTGLVVGGRRSNGSATLSWNE